MRLFTNSTRLDSFEFDSETQRDISSDLVLLESYKYLDLQKSPLKLPKLDYTAKQPVNISKWQLINFYFHIFAWVLYCQSSRNIIAW